MGRLQQVADRIDQIIDRQGLDPFRTKGQISMRCGFFVSLIHPDDPDDDAKVSQLCEAATEVLGEPIRA
jgi:hypothetical protein